ncbi:MAG: hypothetical protein ACPGLV_01650 [Bacteroidia bacterium]
MQSCFHFLILTFLALSVSSCNGLLFGNNDCKNCDNVACTKEHKLIGIRVKDKNNEAVELSHFKVLFTQSNKEIKGLNSEPSVSLGYYIIATDSMLKDLDCDGTSITFTYSTDGENYKSENFKIGRDCCHIQYSEEKALEIIID